MRNVEIVENKGLHSVFRATFKDQKEDKSVDFTAPSSPMDFQKFIAGLPPAVKEKNDDGEEYFTGPLADAYDEYMYAIITHAKQSEREQTAALSTVITRDGRKIDLMAINVSKAILVVNAGYAMASATESDVPTALVNTRKKLIDEKKVVAVDDFTVKIAA